MLFYGGIGWLLSSHFHQVWIFVVGMIVGFAASVYLIVKRYGSCPTRATTGRVSERDRVSSGVSHSRA